MKMKPSLFASALLSAALLLIPIMAACFPYNYSLLSASKLVAPALWPGEVVANAIFGEADLPFTVLVCWIFYSVLLWPLTGFVRRGK